MAREPLVPDNTLWRTILIETVNGETGATEPVTTGTTTAYLVAAASPTAAAAAIAADPSLSISCVHVGVDGGEFPLGTWLITFLGSILTLSMLETCFPTSTGATKPYLVIQRAGSLRVIERLHYKRARKAILA